MSKKLHIKTWGCQMNEYDSAKMVDLLTSSLGYETTELPEEADLLVLNTCSIREKRKKTVPPVRTLERTEKEKSGAGDRGRRLRGIAGR